MNYQISVSTYEGSYAVFHDINPVKFKETSNEIEIYGGMEGNCIKLTAKSIRNETIKNITHTLSIGLRNFSTVIIPDGGREYSNGWHPVYFWANNKASSINSVRVPLFIFNGIDKNASFAFGIIGKEYETEFKCIQPDAKRALSAYYRKLTIQISRGDIPASYTGNQVTEYAYIRDFQHKEFVVWTDVLGEFCEITRNLEKIEYEYCKPSMEPLWCSWTDWFSDDVTEEVILDNVKEGVKLGIKNYIIDDGWFGPGLDNEPDVVLNIGDWTPDPAKIKDVKALSRNIRALGGRSVIWCAPHAVGALAKCREDRKHLLMKDDKGELVTTHNQFNILCIRSREAREVMSDICVRLASLYETDGAKYDLFNCIPDIKCTSCEHEHDTKSGIEGLELLLKSIYEKTKKINPDYIIELKQNYAGAKLAKYGTMVRAGDTPYAPDGNFLRTAFIQGYTPYAINDYQTITEFNTPLDNTRIVIKMLAVGVPSYSMNIGGLGEDTKKMLKFLNERYMNDIIKEGEFKRQAQNGLLSIWTIKRKNDEVHFLIDSAGRVNINSAKDFEIVNGSDGIVLIKGSGKYQLDIFDYQGKHASSVNVDLSRGFEIDNRAVLVKGKRG